MEPAIKIENLSKQYRLGLVGTGTLSHDLKRWWHLIRGKEDPYSKIGETNDRSKKGVSGYVWALKDINLEVMPGEVLGIIGKNGAGKSTLLKILSKVTGPTTGSITYKGRIGSLLEVGTGFHPELTGRENIYLNGAILGMRKKEIDRKFDEIVDFSGVERYIDTPTKRYSSGMTVRLGFAVAAFLEPEILVVDEVLAVGDAEFQKKAIGKMQDVSKNEGRTVLFVSHNMFSIKRLCKIGVLLKNGMIAKTDQINKVVEEYELENNLMVDIDLINRNDRKGSGKIKATKCILKSSNNTILDTITCGDNFLIEVELTRCTPDYSAQKKVEVAVNICNLNGERILQLSNKFIGKIIHINHERITLQYRINKLQLNPGRYFIRLFVGDEIEILDWIDHCLAFNVGVGDFFGTGYLVNNAIFFADHTIKVLKN
jgi:lipopolysaccharide transport system ATP-binding protein